MFKVWDKEHRRYVDDIEDLVLTPEGEIVKIDFMNMETITMENYLPVFKKGSILSDNYTNTI